MAVELGGISLKHLTQVAVRENARIAYHAVPGMSGDLAQTLGRPSVAVLLRGIFYGAPAGDELKQLRAAYLANQPVDFFAEAVGEGYFTQVLIAKLEVSQRAGYLDQFDYLCEVVEYVTPPEPAAANLFASINADLLNEATAFIDEAQNAIDQASQLVNLIANVPEFTDPLKPLSGILDDFGKVVTGELPKLTSIAELF